MQVVVFHPGTQHSRTTARALHDLDRLAFLASSLLDAPGRLHLPGPPGRALDRAYARYRLADLPPDKLRAHGLLELAERAVARLGLSAPVDAIDRWGNRDFGRWIARTAAREGPFALWGYNASALTAFTDPRTAGMPKVLDRTVAGWRLWHRVHARTLREFPEWVVPYTGPPSERRIAQQNAEMAAADRIVCGSPFVAESLREEAEVPGIEGKLAVLPYCWDRGLFGGAPEPAGSQSGAPLKLLFVGQLSARKGIQHVLAAFDRLPAGSATLTLAGPLMIPPERLAPYRERIRYLGNLPRAEIPALMQAHEVFVFPSHFEGSAIVLLEAMASGLALVQSREAGLGASAHSGIVLDATDADHVEAALRALIADPARVLAMRRAAQREAQDYDFAAYRSRVAALLAEMGL